MGQVGGWTSSRRVWKAQDAGAEGQQLERRERNRGRGVTPSRGESLPSQHVCSWGVRVCVHACACTLHLPSEFLLPESSWKQEISGSPCTPQLQLIELLLEAIRAVMIDLKCSTNLFLAFSTLSSNSHSLLLVSLSLLPVLSKRYESQLRDLERQSEQQRETLAQLQQEFQRAQAAKAGAPGKA